MSALKVTPFIHSFVRSFVRSFIHTHKAAVIKSNKSTCVQCVHNAIESEKIKHINLQSLQTFEFDFENVVQIKDLILVADNVRVLMP